MVLAGTLREKASHSSLFEGGEGKNPTLFYAGVIIIKYYLIIFYAVSIHGGWVMTVRNLCFRCALASVWLTTSITGLNE